MRPSTNGVGGRDCRGRFSAGNGFGQGNPHVGSVAKFRTAMLAAVSEKDIQKIISSMVKVAIKGDVAAARFVISYMVGAPAEITSVKADEDNMEEITLLRAVPIDKLIELAKNPKS